MCRPIRHVFLGAIPLINVNSRNDLTDFPLIDSSSIERLGDIVWLPTVLRSSGLSRATVVAALRIFQHGQLRGTL